MDNNFDTDKVIYKQKEPPYKINYYIYKNNEPYTEHFTEKDIRNEKLRHKKNTVTACFSQLLTMLRDFSIKYKEWPNRLLFLCNFKHCDLSVTHEEILWWVTNCKKYKLLPDYIANGFIETGNFILKVNKIDLNSLYIYLSNARYLQENHYFIKAIKYLVEDKNMDFYVAFAVASRCCMCSTVHHIIPISKQYPFFKDHNDINVIDTFNLDDVIRLRIFLEGNKAIEKIKLENIDIGTSLGRFCLHNTISKIAIKRLTVKRENLTSKGTTKQIYL